MTLDPYLIVIGCLFSFVLGSVMASFGGVVSYRVPRKISIITPPSQCMECHHRLSVLDNIPIFSYLFLKGKCRYCHSKIGPLSFWMEVIGGVSYLLAFLFIEKDYFLLLFEFPLITLLQIIAWEDIEEQRINDIFQLVFLLLTIGYVLYGCLSQQVAPWSQLIGMGIGLSVFGLIYLISKTIYHQEALGTGDIILVMNEGLLLGYQKLLLSLLVASLSGSIIELIRLAIKKEKKEIPFAPYLASGIFVALIFGDLIIEDFIKGVIIHGLLSM